MLYIKKSTLGNENGGHSLKFLLSTQLKQG
uniref:Uncharacterized protein n=1 Tax=Anguilla anguilla TaxID=7936 RepID=A0A0E9VP29_ANGAN